MPYAAASVMSDATSIIETERLVLRPFEDADLDAYFAIHDHPAVRASLRIPGSFDRAQAWAQLAMWRGQMDLRGTGHLAVVRRDTGEMIGRAGSHHPERSDWPGIEIGWTLHPDHWGHGFATEAGRATVARVFDRHPVDVVYSVIHPDNAPSQAVARRLGFTLREVKELSILPGEPHGIWVLRR